MVLLDSPTARPSADTFRLTINDAEVQFITGEKKRCYLKKNTSKLLVLLYWGILHLNVLRVWDQSNSLLT